MKYIKTYETISVEDFLNSLKRYIIVFYQYSIKYQYVIFEVIETNIDKKSYIVKKIYTYNSELNKFKKHTQKSFQTSYYVLGPNMIFYTSDSLTECKEKVVLECITKKYNL